MQREKTNFRKKRRDKRHCRDPVLPIDPFPSKRTPRPQTSHLSTNHPLFLLAKYHLPWLLNMPQQLRPLAL